MFENKRIFSPMRRTARRGGSAHNFALVFSSGYLSDVIFLFDCGRPVYHYDPSSLPAGFPAAAAINLSVKCIAAAQLKAATQQQRSPSVMDLSTSSVTSTSPQVRTTALYSMHQKRGEVDLR